ncbi:MAG TPA: 16S rRNA (adenine(1518)-N(6)/adenine(1519)-N(6))-dimethyltransferase RsmA [Candidatus Eremiobacteraceae bacterium]|nr:16S rRNA (adenine(1518)-N(6)/adenine(1519)-N(6))-dimethyltransferase RsmA [Candidatus Eremiobacteraceae bacterium]
MSDDRYASPKRLLESLGLRPRKRFGQNFLLDARLAAKVASAVPARASIVEIGGGVGSLTVALQDRATTLTVLEIDRDLVPILRERFAGDKKVEIRECDALEFDFAGYFRGVPAPRAICGNLPYNITTPLIERILACAGDWEVSVLMVQREYAQRLTAAPGKPEYGSLTVFVGYRCRTRKLVDIGAGGFYPPPAVASSVVVLEPHAASAPRAVDERLFFALTRASFAQRRKMVANSIASALRLEPAGRKLLAAALEAARIDGQTRAERIDVGDYIRLADALHALGFTLPGG